MVSQEKWVVGKDDRVDLVDALDLVDKLVRTHPRYAHPSTGGDL